MPELMLPPIMQDSSGFHCQVYEPQVVDEPMFDPGACLPESSSFPRSTDSRNLREQPSGYQCPSVSPLSRDTPRASARFEARYPVPATEARKLHVRHQAGNRRRIRRNMRLLEPYLSLSDSSDEEDDRA